MKVLAPAKINLGLHITSRRPDGYHNLSSLVCFCKFGDFIEIRESDVSVVTFSGPFSEGLCTENNSLLSALNWFNSRHSVELNYEISVQKNIPVQAGLGGGTADAASFLRALYDTHGFSPPNPPELSELGADVPVSFLARTALMSGIGEQLKITSLDRDYGIVLVNTGVAISTKDIFQNMSEFSPPIDYKSEYNLSDLQNLTNNMTKTASQLCVEIDELISFMRGKNAVLSRMTGSGATVFALTELGGEHDLAAQVKDTFSNYWVTATQTSRSTT